MKKKCRFFPELLKIWKSKEFLIIRFTVGALLILNAQGFTNTSHFQATKIKSNTENESIQQIVLSAASLHVQLIPEQLTVSVSGKVIDKTGTPLPGVTVVIKGTTSGTITNADGNFSMSNVSSNATLLFSFVGMKTQEVAVDGKKTINVILAEDAIALEEVVAVGFGSQRKKDLTGSIIRVDVGKTKNLPTTNVLQNLQGSVPGVYVGQQLRPGEQPSLRIRGIKSLTASNSPLIIIDGVIFDGSLNHLDANDIESVDILKDASAAAVYGSRSANGVIIITTKKGKSDKPEFNLNSYFGVSDPVRMLDPLNGAKYIQRILDHRLASGLGVDKTQIVSYLRANELDNYSSGQETNWIDDLLQTGTVQNHHIDVSGKTDKTNYYIGGTFLTQKGIVENDNFNRVAFKANFSNKITDWLTIGLKTTFTNLNYDGYAADVNTAYYMSPYGKYWSDAAKTQYEWYPHNEVVAPHPKLNFLIDNVDRQNNLSGLGNLILDIPFIPGLQFNMDFSGNLTNTKKNDFTPFNHPSGYNANGIASKFYSEGFDWNWNNILNYKRIIAKDHSINITLLYSRGFRKIESTTSNGSNFFTDALEYNNLNLAGVQTVASDYGDENSIAYMGRINYSFKNRYLLTATYRRDGFSGFGEGHKWADFPSFGFGWTITEENFLKETKWLDLLKFRLSYGKNGNQALGRYKTLATIATSQYVYDATTVTASTINTIANKELGWETTKGYNVGLDFGIFKNRVNGSVDAYSTDTYNLILNRSLPTTSGFASTYQNLGKVHNYGIDLSLNATILQKEKLNWDIGFVYSMFRNRIVHLYGTDSNKDGIEDDDIGNGWFIGKSLGSLYSYQVDGIYQIEDKDILPGFKTRVF